MARSATTRTRSQFTPLDALQQVAAAPSLEALAATVQQIGLGLFDATHTRLVMLIDHDDHLHSTLQYPELPEFSEFVPFDWLRSGQPFVWQVGDLDQPIAPYTAARFKSALVLPLTARGTLVGMLELGRRNKERWSEADLEQAQVIAGQVALTLALFHVELDGQRRNAEIATLNDIAATITSTLDPRQVYRLVVQKINEYFQVEAGSLLLEDQETGELMFVMTLEFGIVSDKLTDVRVPRGQGFVGESVRTGEPVIVNDAQSDPRFYRRVSEDVGFVTRSVLCVPMMIKGRNLGVIQLLNKVEGEFLAEDAARLSAMANTIGVAIDNANLFQEVSQNRNRLQAILNSTQDAILTIDNDDVVLTANPMVEEFFGLRWRHLAGRSGTEVLAEIKARTTPIDMPGDGQEFEIAQPEHRFVREVVLPVHNISNEQLGTLIVFHDVTQEHELDRMREDYTGMLVHDLRAPLTAIINGLTMVRRGFAGEINPQQRELLDLASNSSQEMIGMINTLLDISKMEAGQMILNRAPCSVYEIVERACERIITSARSANITVHQGLALNLPIIDADQDKLVRVLQNLLDNAIKFTPLNGEVAVQVRLLSTSEHGTEVVWSVTDHGPGIPPEYLTRIFDKFVQVGQKKGTGLGLAFSKLTTEAHGGRIWVESTETQGSTFSFTTPYNPA